MNKVLLSTAYLAPIQYYSKLVRFDYITIEKYENFIKQTYRNRCVIYGANGILALSIPVTKDKPKELIKDIKIYYKTNWRKMHLKSIESAYRSSPFFEYYIDDFLPFYSKEFKFLIDFNTEIQNTVLENLELEKDIRYTTEYKYTLDLMETQDLREVITPKKNIFDPDFIAPKYNQVFSSKYGFVSNLSILDLLFNEGPNTIDLLSHI
jgi:hypothetical protein